MRSLLVLFSLFLLFACETSQDKAQKAQQVIPNQHAQFFRIAQEGDSFFIDVINPWDNSKALQQFLLYPKTQPKPKAEDGRIVLAYPLDRVACAHTTQIAFLNELNVLESVVGVGQKAYVQNPVIIEGFEKGKIQEFSNGQQFDYEKLLAINPQAITVAPLKNEQFEKALQLDFKLIYNMSYMETSPLARAEWLKFMAVFYGKLDAAQSKYNEIVTQYQYFKELTNRIEKRPTVFSGKRYGPNWYIPGGQSYMAQLYRDAGAHYLWEDTKISGSEVLDFESVFAKAAHADYWCFVTNAPKGYSKTALLEEYNNYKDFDAYTNADHIIYCNSAVKSFYEEGILEPHLILGDLIYYLHPNLLKDYTPKYFKHLE